MAVKINHQDERPWRMFTSEVNFSYYPDTQTHIADQLHYAATRVIWSVKKN